MDKNVNEQIQVAEERIQEARQLVTNLQEVLRLIDLMYLDEDDSKRIPS